MGMIIYWTRFAENKLEEIFTYYKLKAGISFAKNLVNGIVDASLNLEQNPYSGPVEDLLSERIQEFRYLVFKNYKIIYWVDGINKKIFISNIFDTRQNPHRIKITP